MSKSRKILIVEDDANLLSLLKGFLSKKYDVKSVTDGRDVLDIVKNWHPDLIILDILLPGIDGLALCRMIRLSKESRDTLILMLTSKGTEVDKISGLDRGADDYIVKPASLDDLSVRIENLFRRVDRQNNLERSLYLSGQLYIDHYSGNVVKKGSQIQLTDLEFKVLSLLARNVGVVLSHDLILTSIWGQDTLTNVSSLRTVVTRLRGKIEDNPFDPKIITTVRDIGYRFEDK